MNLPIRIKFIAILVVAAVLPLCIALTVAETLGYRYYWQSQGSLFMARAQSLANELDMSIGAEVGKLSDWTALSDLHHQVPSSPAGIDTHAVDKEWATLGPMDPPLKEILENPASKQLRMFQSVNPLFPEIFLTDRRGLLVAATGKTSDYIQSDEEWWKKGIALRFKQVYAQGIHLDESARVYSLDVVMPVCDPEAPLGMPIGVLKAVLDVSPLFSSAREVVHDDARREVVFSDGKILAELARSPASNIVHGTVPFVADENANASEGWFLTRGTRDRPRELLGYALLKVTSPERGSMVSTGLTPLYVVVHRDAETILEPVRRNILVIGALGAALILGFTLAGYYIATTKIIGPMQRIQAVAKRLASEIKAEEPTTIARPLPELALLRTVKTGDEIESFARDFESMATKVLTYHEQLESEIAQKTAAMEGDLRMAREFQEALMPRSYPQVPGEGHRDAVDLHFEHIYRPASSVGGDFFDVMKLSEHRAGVFIADVMGHGARSALVTAILRALLQNLVPNGNDPARFLSDLNQHFYDIVRSSGETIFVSAFYLVIDTETATASYASAGHPSPLIAHREKRQAEFLMENNSSGPALGLFALSAYVTLNRPVEPGEIFLLYTDGVHEAYNAHDEEFGLTRLRDTVRENLDDPSASIASKVVQAVHRFIAPQTPADDLCLVTVEARSPASQMQENASVVTAAH